MRVVDEGGHGLRRAGAHPGDAPQPGDGGRTPRLVIQLVLDAPHLVRQQLDLLEQHVPPQPLRPRRQLKPTEPLQAPLRPQGGPPRGHDAGASQQRAEGVLHPRPLCDHPAAAGDQLAPGPDIGRRHMHRRRLFQVEQLGHILNTDTKMCLRHQQGAPIFHNI
jgi:hypothetical protein